MSKFFNIIIKSCTVEIQEKTFTCNKSMLQSATPNVLAASLPTTSMTASVSGVGLDCCGPPPDNISTLSCNYMYCDIILLSFKPI